MALTDEEFGEGWGYAVCHGFKHSFWAETPAGPLASMNPESV